MGAYCLDREDSSSFVVSGAHSLKIGFGVNFYIPLSLCSVSSIEVVHSNVVSREAWSMKDDDVEITQNTWYCLWASNNAFPCGFSVSRTFLDL